MLQGHRHIFNKYLKDGICYITNSTPIISSNPYQKDGFESGCTGFAQKPNFGGDAGTIAGYINRPGWTQLEVSATEIHGDCIDILGRKLDSFAFPQKLVVTFTPDGGEFPAPVSVRIDCGSPGAELHYTTDGRDPTLADSSITAGGSVLIGSNTALKVRAFGQGHVPGDPKTSDYAIRTQTPAFSLSPGIYGGPQFVTISSATPGATIHYTTSGTDPTSSDSVASAPGTCRR